MPLPIRNARLTLPQGQIFWRELGQGIVLVFLHNSWSDGSEWIPVMEQLGRDFHCFAPDLLGFGESDRPRAHYSIEFEVECLTAYLDSLKLRRVYLIGQGIGGWVAASYALQYPHQVEGLVLLGAEGLPVRGRPHHQRWWFTRIPLLIWALRMLSPVARWLGQGDRIQQWLQEARLLKQHPAACQLLFNRRKVEIQAEYVSDRLSWLKTPLLILQGEEDGRATVLLNQGYANAPDATINQYPGADLVQTAPEIVAREVRSFVRRMS
ncbi:alpha/beta hydrolase [Oscillatoria sp. FACHB-1407]|uniref:alpha/beta fold hydrolase n=1 Tax=Oscillatoria sp. FACHB-1407 TaxID=2692847 RepID=UPI0016866396|nr:alpha/beta hydrolase [Oscillatoria sp. FACHB-1407]MBD2465148.1 alpha/beta hydrolase [Oscillatoria sp. FACHB-1407]